MTTLESKLVHSWPPGDWCDVTVTVAVSGGADSVALLHAMKAVRVAGRGAIIVAHFNHRLRADQSDEDARFVAELASSMGLGFEIGEARIRPTSEDDARAVRYDFLQQAACKTGARFLATAHTANDQAETVLHRIIRGTGLEGLQGIPRIREMVPGISIIRPMLDVTREEVLAYLRHYGRQYREDASNASLQFTRNRLRRELLPHLAEHYNANINDALLRLSELSSEAFKFIGGEVDRLADRCVLSCDDEKLTLDCQPLLEHDDYLCRQLLRSLWKQQDWPLRQMTYQKWRQLFELCGRIEPKPITLHFPGNIRATKTQGQLRLIRTRAADAGRASKS